LELSVHKVCQTASGGSHVTRYEADLEFVPGPVQIQVGRVDPANASAQSIEMAVTAIRQGAERVLQPRGQGAIIRIKHLVIHPIDFKPRRYEQYTAEELDRLFATAG